MLGVLLFPAFTEQSSNSSEELYIPRLRRNIENLWFSLENILDLISPFAPQPIQHQEVAYGVRISLSGQRDANRYPDELAPTLNDRCFDIDILRQLLRFQIRSPSNIVLCADSPLPNQQCPVMKPQCNITFAETQRLSFDLLLDFRVQSFWLDFILHKSLLHSLCALPSLRRMAERTETTDKTQHPLAVTRTELVWEGKYDSAGNRVAPLRVALPFQTVETVNESAADRRHTLELFGQHRQTEWRNRLIWGDKKYVLPSLLAEFAGKVNLIYIDPPFDTGADFSFTASVPNHPDKEEDDSATFTKEPSIIEHKAYRDTWGRGLDSYLQWFYETAVLLHECFTKPAAFMCIWIGMSAITRRLLDEVFGPDNFVNEIVWKRNPRRLTNPQSIWDESTTSIVFYTKTENYTWNQQYMPYDQRLHRNNFDKQKERWTDVINFKSTSPRPAAPNASGKGITPPSDRIGASKETMEA